MFNCQGAGWCRVIKKTRIHDSAPATITGSVRIEDVDSIAQLAGPGWNGEAIIYAFKSGLLIEQKFILCNLHSYDNLFKRTILPALKYLTFRFCILGFHLFYQQGLTFGHDLICFVLVFFFFPGELIKLPKDATLSVTLKVLEFELFHVCPIKVCTSYYS